MTGKEQPFNSLAETFNNLMNNIKVEGKDGKFSDWWRVYNQAQSTIKFEFNELINFAKAALTFQAMIGGPLVIEKQLYIHVPVSKYEKVKKYLSLFFDGNGFREIYYKDSQTFIISCDSAIVLRERYDMHNGGRLDLDLVTRNKDILDLLEKEIEFIQDKYNEYTEVK